MTTCRETPQPVMPLPRLRPAQLEDRAQIQQLESAHGLLTPDAHDRRSFWHDNPLRRRLGDDRPIGWVFEDAGGHVVGSLTNVLSRYAFRGADLIVATGRSWVVSRAYRGVALWLMDEYFNQDGVDLFINTTVNSLAVDPFSAFGSARVPLGDWETAAYWVTGYRGFARAALRIKGVPLPGLLAPPAAGALKLKDSFHADLNSLSAIPALADIAEAGEFDLRFDAFWNELVRQRPETLLGVRDRETLAWHFAGPLRTGDVWIFTASRNRRLRAYCILKRQDHPPSGLLRMRLVDYQNLEPGEDLLPGLLRAALLRCAAEGIHVLEHVGCALPKMRTLDRFAPYRRKLPAWPFYYKAADPTLDADLQNPEVWDPSTFDGDASL